MSKKVSAYLVIAGMLLCLLPACLRQGEPYWDEDARWGTVMGRLIDETNNDVIIGATVSLSGTDLKGSTNINGTYTIRKVPAGTYDMTFEHIDYVCDTIREVRVSASVNYVDVRMARKDQDSWHYLR